MKVDLRHYDDHELSHIVFNTEYLYNKRKSKTELLTIIEKIFNFTDKQFDILLLDLNNIK